MMVRKLDEGVKSRLMSRAQRNGRNLEAEVREILTRAAEFEESTGEAEALGTRIARRFVGIGFKGGEIEELRGDWGMQIPDFSGPEFDR